MSTQATEIEPSSAIAVKPRRLFRGAFAGEKFEWFQTIPFWGVHVAAVVTPFWLGWSWRWFGFAMILYAIRMFWLTAGYHRYLSHRSFKTSRWFQFVFALMGTLCVQKGPLWWAAHHRDHHKYSDLPQDVHSSFQRGFTWAHMGWILVTRYMPTEWDNIKDLAKYPELRWLNNHYLLPAIAFAVLLQVLGGREALMWGFFVSTTLLWHGTFTVNSLAHQIGRPRYRTGDKSRNSFFIAAITLGEGWHNNHHHYQRSERQGFFWWEMDITHYVLKLFSVVGLVWDLHEPPPAIRNAHKIQAQAEEAA